MRISREVMACVRGMPVAIDSASVVVLLPLEYVPEMAR
jgi:hypothetical protein